MSEETRKLSAFEAFQQTQLSFAEAEEKAKSEAGAPRVDRFRIGEDGEYPVRILPLAPNFDDNGNILPMDRKGYEYAVHQFFLSIKVPSKNGKTKKINIPVIRTTDKEVGYSVDLLDTYVKIAKEMYADDEELIKFISKSPYEGGIRWNYQHAMMLLDVSSDKERAKGPQLWQCSHSQYKDIDAAKMRLWKELREDGDQHTCPITGFTGAYPVKIIRSNNNGKTEYTFEIGRKTLDIKEEEVLKLLDLPRIPEQIYRFTRYQLEAIIVFLQQYDEEHDMEVCQQTDFKEAVEKLKGELPADDTSHFDLAGVASGSSSKEEVTIDSLYAEYNDIVDQDLGEKSDEYMELREKIRQFIEDKGLDVRISRTKNNRQLLDEIDEALDDQDGVPSKDTFEENNSDANDEAIEVGEDLPRRRPARPTGNKGIIEAEPDPSDDNEEDAIKEAQSRRRLHTRRIR